MVRMKIVLLQPAALLVSVLLVDGCGQVSLSEDERFERAQQHEEAGDLRAASIELRNLLQQNPNHAEGRMALGTVSLA
ncbi:MAG: hypothetical protein R6V11_02220, partial [Ectothiorhodospiraceae bacterium]